MSNPSSALTGAWHRGARHQTGRAYNWRVTDDERQEVHRLIDAHEQTVAVCRACAETTRDLAWEVKRGAAPTPDALATDHRRGRAGAGGAGPGRDRDRADEGVAVVVAGGRGGGQGSRGAPSGAGTSNAFRVIATSV